MLRHVLASLLHDFNDCQKQFLERGIGKLFTRQCRLGIQAFLPCPQLQDLEILATQYLTHNFAQLATILQNSEENLTIPKAN